MSYSGNPALGTDAQKRILGTFEQTLDLASAGNRQEALLGCDFVLRMDPQFEPARRLQERLHASTGPVALDDLRPGAAGGGGDDEFGFSFLPELDALADGDLKSELKKLLAERRFHDVIERAQQSPAELTADPELGALAMQAVEKLESEPYVVKFLAAARSALASGQAEEARRALDKARALDPDHPEIAALDAEVKGGIGATPADSLFRLEPAASPPAAPTSASESDRRIAQLLEEGQAAFEKGDPQGAIDSWSRIFLIDIDHEEAARRIESARRQKAESERQIEEIFHDGLTAYEVGDTSAARAAFERVVALQPGHLAAREQLEMLASGQPARSEALSSLESGPAFGAAPPSDLKEEILVPPEGATTQPRRERKERTPATAVADGAPAGRAKRTFLLVGAGVLALVLVAGWFLFQNRDRLFPNSESEIPLQAQGTDAITRAKKLHDAGKVEIAINQLKRIPANEPSFAEAQKLIAAWQAGGSGTPATAVPGPTPEQVAAREPVLAQAREAYSARGYLKAAALFKQAAEIAPLAGTDGELFEDAKRQLVPISTQVQLFHDHEWEMLLPQLWRLREANPGNLDVQQMLVDCYYDLGVRELQRSNPVKALQQFQEAQKLAPGDAELGRNLAFAKAYQGQSPDLLYRIFVKYTRFR